MRGIDRSALQGAGDHRLDLVIGHRARPTRPRLIQQALEPVGHKPRPPFSGAADMNIKLVGDRGVPQPVGGSQHNPRPIANAFALFDRLDHATNWACSSSVNVTAAAKGLGTHQV